MRGSRIFVYLVQEQLLPEDGGEAGRLIIRGDEMEIRLYNKQRIGLPWLQLVTFSAELRMRLAEVIARI